MEKKEVMEPKGPLIDMRSRSMVQWEETLEEEKVVWMDCMRGQNRARKERGSVRYTVTGGDEPHGGSLNHGKEITAKNTTTNHTVPGFRV